MKNKLMDWIWVLGLGFGLLFTLWQFELIVYHQVKAELTDWMYKQMVVEAAVMPKLAITGTNNLTLDIVAKIHLLESSGGKFDSCKKLGLVNGYGFNQGTKKQTCFGKEKDVKTLVTNWVNDKLSAGLNVPQLLCLYNTGKATKTCNYYENYLKI